MKTRFKKKRYAWQPKSQLLSDWMTSKLGVVVINWVLQGMLGMDHSERIFKLSLDLGLTIVGTLLLVWIKLSWWMAILLGFVLAHTLNWLLNTHFWVMGRFIGITHTPPAVLVSHIHHLADVARREPSLRAAVIIGRVTRGGRIRNTSDIDIEFVRKKGAFNAIRANLFGLREKVRAFFARIPLDSYIYDDVETLGKHRRDETPIILYDPEHALKEYYRNHRNQDYELLEDAGLEHRLEDETA